MLFRGSRGSWEERRAMIGRRAWRARSVGDHLVRAGDSGLRQCLGTTDLFFLGIGCIIGAGVYVLSGVAANQHAGPAVTLSYLISALAAFLSALCYAEFAVELPVSGGAFNYISITFGELAAWLTGWNMCLEATLSSAAVARGFASYLATLCGLAPADVRMQVGPLQIDLTALLLIVVLTAVLAKGTKESSQFNMVVVSCNLLVICFILLMGFPLADPANLEPFMPFGARGMFSAASIVFFGYVGFDYVANAAEEVIDPARSLPIGLLGSLAVASALYALMALALVMMVPYQLIDIHAPFSAAFIQHGLHWAAKLVSSGAVFGIVASTMTGLLGQARLLVVLGRERLLPGWLAHVHAGTGTPLKATLVTGACAGLLAVVLDIGVLAELVSVGTLFVFAMVCAAVIYRRCYAPTHTPSSKPVLARLLVIVAASLGGSLSFTYAAPGLVVLLFLLLWLAATLSLLLLPIAHVPPRFRVPLFPLTPSLGVISTVHLMCSLGWPAYVRFAVWVLAGLAIYFLYGAPAAEERDVQQAMERAAAEEEGGGREDQFDLPFRLPPLEYEGPVDELRSTRAQVELSRWEMPPSPGDPAPLDNDRVALLPQRALQDSAAGG